MPKVSALGLGTEVGKQILSDFQNWNTTGFRPWGTGIGGVAHYKSRKCYQVVTLGEFRSQAQKIAKLAREQMSDKDAGH